MIMRGDQYRKFAVVVFSIASILVALAEAEANWLVTSDPGNIRSYSDDGTTYLGDFTSGGPALNGPSALSFGPNGNLYVLSGSEAVYRYNGITGAYIDTFITGLEDAKDMRFGSDGNLYISNNRATGGEVLRFDGVTGTMDVFIPNGRGGLTEPMGLAFGRDGNLYVGHDGGGVYNVLRFSGPTGAFMGKFVPDNDHGLADPNGLLFGPDGSLYISNEGTSALNNHTVLHYDQAGNFIDLLSGAGLVEPHGLAFGPDGNLYVTGSDSHTVHRSRGTTGQLDIFVAPGLGGLEDPKGLVYINVNAVPEPKTYALIMVGLGFLGFMARRRKKLKDTAAA
jgi:sugar lactone lactonase YvrE